MELAALDITFDATFIEEGGYHIHATLVAYQDDFVGQMFWTDVEVEHATILIDNELASRKDFFHEFRSLEG
jgi:hypothetical protein